VALWEVDIYPLAGQPDLIAARVSGDAAQIGLGKIEVAAARGFLIQSGSHTPELKRADAERIARELLCDSVVERAVVGLVGGKDKQDAALGEAPAGKSQLVQVLPKPGVMDPTAQSVLSAIADLGLKVDAVRTLHKYWLAPLEPAVLKTLATKVLANDAIEQSVVGPLPFTKLELGSKYAFQLITVPYRELDDAALAKLSKTGQLYLSLVEMQTIQKHFVELGRDPTDAELETIAQTWSEHCSHKTLAGRIRYTDGNQERTFKNMLKETIFAATQELRKRWGDKDWCVSVFKDNAGVITFDETNHVCFKVETHNHPSALEPYGGANTGLGGVIRDPLGTGLGAKPVCNTDVFCFAPPDLPADRIPQGVLHPQRVLKGVVSGVRDYGNRMGIPTVNGALYFDERYLANPLVYCGNVGLIPVDKAFKKTLPNDYIVAVGGRTGRDGIHGATFSSAELTTESETLSGGAVQIGNAITEKMVLDVILEARDRGLYTAITDCGAGGFSSAVGEMGEELGAEVWLDRIPLKYDGLTYTEMWISEAQERMVLSVSADKWKEFAALCASESVEATIIGKFVETHRLKLLYGDNVVADLSMEFLHGGRPPVVREATYIPAPTTQQPLPSKYTWDYTPELKSILGSLNVASKEWVVRQYDHEVQAGSVVKPFVGAENDGPSDAAVVRPVPGNKRAIVIGNGMNPHYGDFDTYHMAACAIDEALRNCVAVGADPKRIAILDNFCWGDCELPETLGSLVRAALACYDLALVFETPFISGKDSLNNVFRFNSADGKRNTISIPPSLLISAIGQMDDAAQAVTMDLKEAGNLIYQVGTTRNELGGSHFALTQKLSGGQVPQVQPELAKRTFEALHKAIKLKLVRACHDLSEGGLAAAAAEMAFAGDLGARIHLAEVPYSLVLDPSVQQKTEQLAQDHPHLKLHPLSALPEASAVLLFAESASRFLCEVPQAKAKEFEKIMSGVPHALIGDVTDTGRLEIFGLPQPIRDDAEKPSELRVPRVVDATLADLKETWKKPLRFE
jgi:phosphoribosylformylglycinamidine synthase II